MSSGRFGAYGFAIQNLDDASDWLNPAPDTWPNVTLRQQDGEAASQTRIGDQTAEIALLGDRSVLIRRTQPEVSFIGPSNLSSAALIHPYLAPAASVLAHWQGWSTFHAGAFEVDGHAWLIAADRNGGKSTTLSALAESGYPVLGDDLIVLKDGVAFAGPRSLDLREPAQFHDVEDLGIVGERRRWRMWLPPVSPEIPVAGIIKLSWSDKAEMRKISTEDRAEFLQPTLSMPPEPRGMLTLLSLRTYEVIRPPGPLEDTVNLIGNVIER